MICFGYIAGVNNLVRFQLVAEQPQYLAVFGHMVTPFIMRFALFCAYSIIKAWFLYVRNFGFLMPRIPVP